MFDFLYLFKDCKNYEKSYVNLRAKKGFIDEFNKSLYFMAILCLIQFVYYEKAAWVLSKLCYLAQPTVATYGVPLLGRIQWVVCAGAVYITSFSAEFRKFGGAARLIRRDFAVCPFCCVAVSVSVALPRYPSLCRGIRRSVVVSVALPRYPSLRCGIRRSAAVYITILTSNFERFGCFVAPSLVYITFRHRVQSIHAFSMSF